MKCPNCQTENPSESRFCLHCATPLKDDREDFSTIKTAQMPSFDLSRGDIFADRYEIIEDLGEGGMGRVYRAFDQKIKEAVALKLIRPEIGFNTQAIERFRNELKIARKISHRNVCRMYDLGEEGFLTYITMEYVSGEDLKRFVKRAGQLTSGKAIFIAKQVAAGLTEAHRLGVIHRDLKPQNIMIDQDGNARIMDFGIARFVDSDKLTGSGVMIGTPEYMSPEQAELKDVDKRTDIYSLGVVMYEMVTGQVPFEGETPLSIVMKHKSVQPRNVREINTMIPKDLASIIAKCLEKDRAKRYQSAEEFIADLNSVERGLSTQERVVPKKKAVTAVKKIKKTLPWKQILVPAAAVVGCVIVLLAVLKFLPKKSKEPPVEITFAESQIPFDQTPVYEIIQSPPLEEAAEESLPTSPQPAKKKARPAQRPKPSPEPEKKANPTPPPEPVQKPILLAPNVDGSTAQLGIARMNAARTRAQEKGLEEETRFYQLADARGSDTQKFLAEKKYLESRSLSAALEKLFLISLSEKNDDDRFQELGKYIEGLRRKIDKADKTPQESEVYLTGINYEKQAVDLAANQEYEKSLQSYIEAAVVYEKLLLVIQSREGI